MSWRDVPKPPQIAALPVDERTGFPILFSVQPPEGHPLNFRAVNPANMVRCGKERLCGVCGQRLAYWMYFLGGDQDRTDRLFGEPPMHRECLEYSLHVCPFLSHSYEPLHKPVSDEHGAFMGKDPNRHNSRAERMVIYQTRAFKMDVFSRRVPQGTQVTVTYKAAPFTAIEYRTADGKPLEQVTV